jgi:hypothetical protein
LYIKIQLEEAADITLLGLHMDWNQHTDQNLQKLNAACFVIGKLFPALD